MEKKTKGSSQKKNLAKLQSMKLNDCRIMILKLVDKLLDGIKLIL